MHCDEVFLVPYSQASVALLRIPHISLHFADLCLLSGIGRRDALGEPSTDEKATSPWTLGCHKPVIPVVTFLTPLAEYFYFNWFEQQIGLPFSSESLASSLGNSERVHEDCVSCLDTTTSKVSTSRRPVRVGINASEKNQVILQPSPTLFKSRMQFKGGTHNHSTPRLQLPSLEFSSCTPCNAPFLRYEEVDQAAVDLCVDVPRLRPPSASNSSSSCLTSESISGFKRARDRCLLKATRRARSSARTRSAMRFTLQQ